MIGPHFVESAGMICGPPERAERVAGVMGCLAGGLLLGMDFVLCRDLVLPAGILKSLPLGSRRGCCDGGAIGAGAVGTGLGLDGSMSIETHDPS